MKKFALGCLGGSALGAIAIFLCIQDFRVYLYNSGFEALGQDVSMITMTVGGGLLSGAVAVWRNAKPLLSLALGLLGVLTALSFAALLPNPNPGSFTVEAGIIAGSVLGASFVIGLVIKHTVRDSR